MIEHPCPLYIRPHSLLAEALNDTLVYHWGLQRSKDLFDSFARRNVNPERGFRWPSTEIEETEKPALPNSIHRRTTSELWDLGYRITGMKRSERWKRLCEAVAQLGLQKVAELIAHLCRERKRQEGGRARYANAIREWEHDLTLLKREYYYKSDDKFEWPSSEP